MLDLAGGYTEDGDHIGPARTLRLAKALWWMLARQAGWDGLPEDTTPPAGAVGDRRRSRVHLIDRRPADAGGG